MRPTRITQELIEENVRMGHWDSSVIIDFWDSNAARFPDVEAITDEDARYIHGLM